MRLLQHFSMLITGYVHSRFAADSSSFNPRVGPCRNIFVSFWRLNLELTGNLQFLKILDCVPIVVTVRLRIFSNLSNLLNDHHNVGTPCFNRLMIERALVTYHRTGIDWLFWLHLGQKFLGRMIADRFYQMRGCNLHEKIVLVNYAYFGLRVLF